MTTIPEEPQRARLDEWSADVGDRMARQQLAGGWLRALPTAGVQILGAVASRGRAVTRAELGGVLPVEPVDGDRWSAPCWYDVADEEAEQAATLDRYAAAYDRGPVRTCTDLLDLLAAAGVLWVQDDVIGPVAPVPGVDEVFPVSNDERAEIASLRDMATRLG
ncbi:hypothetical protein JHN59_11565 [Streptomyces sp. MBT49]|uniref:DUF6042 family protein n=1 Tax=unclassified Streptomyces TaxID=2593676 RepID=UPI00190CF954|nr:MULTISPECIES: DUF6042 family protein [unclassified Streptomyces]MBK3625473.1 hypothetical protein [Streptomyces sp. MBT49]MBK3633265.1 hypothetical protein [Streptomyces sp. MBT97]